MGTPQSTPTGSSSWGTWQDKTPKWSAIQSLRARMEVHTEARRDLLSKVPISACWVWQQPSDYVLFPISILFIGPCLAFFGSNGKWKNLAYFLCWYYTLWKYRLCFRRLKCQTREPRGGRRSIIAKSALRSARNQDPCLSHLSSSV